MKKVGWQSIAPIFADVVISPWNLLVGGLLIKYMSSLEAFLSIIFGYSVLVLIFVYYGGIGFKERKQSAEIISKIFNSKITKYLIPSILAIGQIGWASINIELGGKSLAYVLSLPSVWGIIIYALLLIIIAGLDLYKMGVVKLFITISSIGLLAYVFISKFTNTGFTAFLSYKPLAGKSLIWGMSIIIASLISFATVTPDFFQNVKSKRDIWISSLLGLFIPGVVTALLGCFLFFDKGNFDLIALISVLTFPIFPHILNASTNTDGSIAIFTPGLKLQNMFNINLKLAIIISGVISFFLALSQVSTHLETWLKLLSLLFPSLIGLVLVKLFSKENEHVILSKKATIIYAISVIVSFGLSNYFPSVIVSLLLPFLLFKVFFYKKAIL